MFNSKSRDGGVSFTSSDIDAAFRILTWVKQGLIELEEQPAFMNQDGQILSLAKGIRASRAERTMFFQEDLFGEAAWDILLSLYIAGEEGYAMKMTAVCHESGAPMTTALRWIDRLIEVGHVVKRANDSDARSSLLVLSAETTTTLHKYLEHVLFRNMPKGPALTGS